MFKTKFFSLLLFFSINCLAQSKYEKGYFIDDQDVKTNCYIKNDEWFSNPSEFKYKLFEDDEIKKANISHVKEFSITNYSKYIRVSVNVDTSPDILRNLSNVKNPLWKNEQVFLKVIVEGKASLYVLSTENYKRFFYKIDNTDIKQLIFKEFFYNDQQTSFNNTFRQQLFSEIACPHTSVNTVSNIKYKQKELEKYFHHYNSCLDTSFKIATPKNKKGEFNIRFSAGITYSSLSVSNNYVSYADVDFRKKINPTLSIEMEYIPSFRNSQWGVIIGSFYQTYKSQKFNQVGDVMVDFKSLDLFFGIKRYFHLNERTRLFATCFINSLVVYSQGSKVGYRPNTSKLDYAYLNISKYNPNILLGFGIEYNRYFAELRYFSNQNILSHYPNWYSKYEKISLNIGCKILKY